MKKIFLLALFLFVTTNVYAGVGQITVDAYVSPDGVTIGKLDSNQNLIVNAINNFPGGNVQSRSISHDALTNNADPVVRWDEAFRSYEEAKGLDPNYASPISNEGVAWYKLGRPEKALKCFDKAIKINPKHIGAYRNKALLLRSQGKKKESWKYFMKANELRQNKISQFNKPG